ncbi:MAG: Ldh family oxidoreductase [Mesorhizobium sp.]
MTTVTLSEAEAIALVSAALTASNTSSDNALSVARALVAAELVGQEGHGLRRVVAYAGGARSGKVDGQARPQLVRTRPSALQIDAGNGFAFPAIDLALAQLLTIAPEQGIAAAGITRSHHAGVTGLTVEALADAGLAGLFFANSPASIAPWGSGKPLFGTNPIAFACPVENGAPIVIDVSMSKVARGKLMAAHQKGAPIPEGWALDEHGAPTTDAAAGMKGTMVPIGDAKGTALALMVELLAAGITGSNFAYEQSSFFTTDGPPPGTGHAIIAIDPSAFGGVRALSRFAAMAQAVESAGGARVPGYRRHAMRERLRRDGIVVDRALFDDIEKIAAG